MDGLLSRLLDASLQGVIAFVAVLLLVSLFRGLSPTAKGWLWRLCGLKFLVAFAFIVGIPLLPTGDELVNPLPIPSFPTEQFVAQTTKATTVSRPLSTTTPDWTYLFVLLWGTGATVLLGGRVVKELRTRSQIFSQATPVSLDTPGRFFVSPNIHSPLVVGAVHPSIVLPSELIEQPDELAMAIAHEQAHIRRHDVTWQAILNLVACLFWFLPPSYWISTFAKGEAESACDQAVLNSTGKTPGQYARFLVRLAHQPPTITTLGMAAQTRHQLSRRILAMGIQPRLSRAAIAAITILAVPVLLPWQAVAQPAKSADRSTKSLEELTQLFMGIPGAKEEIRFSPEQQKKEEAMFARMNAEWREFGQKLEEMKRAGISDKERLAYDDTVRKPLYLKHRRERWELLTDSQQRRYTEIVLQYLGPMALSNLSVAKLVDLPVDTRKAIAKISAKYNGFLSAQEEAQRQAMRESFGKEIKLREFTRAEQTRLSEINKALFTASGDRRKNLQEEYYEIRKRGIKIQSRPINLKKHQVSSEAKVSAMMDARRREFAKLTHQAERLISAASRKKWSEVTGKPFQFKPWKIDGQTVIAYR